MATTAVDPLLFYAQCCPQSDVDDVGDDGRELAVWQQITSEKDRLGAAFSVEPVAGAWVVRTDEHFHAPVFLAFYLSVVKTHRLAVAILRRLQPPVV